MGTADPVKFILQRRKGDPGPSHEGPTMHQNTVLVVEPDSEVRAGLSLLLAQSGYRVKTARRGGEALELLRAQDAAVVLLALYLPDFDGVTILTAVKRIDPSLPIVLLCPASADEHENQDHQDRVFARLFRPYNAEAVQDTVRRAVAGRRRDGEPSHAKDLLDGWEEPFRALLHSAIDGIVVADQRGSIVGWHGAAGRIFGYAEHEVLGKPLTILMPERYARAHKEGFQRLLFSGESRVLGRVVEVCGLRKDGEEFPLELSLSSWNTERATYFCGITRDITTRKQAEEALRHAEEQFRSIVENAVEGIFQTTPSGQFLRANEALARLLGYDSVEDLLAKVTDIGQQLYCNPEERAGYVAQMERHGFVRGFESRALRKDGTVIWVSVNARAVSDASGRVLHYEGMLQDITHRKQYVERLIKLNNSFIGLGKDYHENVNRLTGACGELLGADWALYSYQDGDLLHSIGRWRAPRDVKAVYPAAGGLCWEVMHRNTSDPFVVRHLSTSPYHTTVDFIARHRVETYVGQVVRCFDQAIGTLAVFFQHDFVPSEADKQILGILASAIGVEEERRHESRALREAYAQLETVLSSLPAGILIVNEEQVILWANPVATGYFRRNTAELVGQPFARVLNPEGERDGRTPVLPELSAPGHGARQASGELTFNDRYFRYWCFPISLRGSHRRQTGIVIWDLTDEKQLLEQLLHAEKLANLGTLVSGLAHEVNNPAQAILGLSELLLDEDDAEIGRGYARDITQYAQHVARVVRDFSTYARPSATEPLGTVDLNQCLTDAILMVQRGKHFDRVDVVRNFAPIPTLHARRTEIDQVFINLISNAAHAMRGKGTLKLATAKEGDFLTARVTDSGSGIPKAVRDRIFDPFFTTKAAGKGTGLGLSIVHKIVSKYGGTIKVESEESKGTTFLIRFPLGGTARDVHTSTPILPR